MGVVTEYKANTTVALTVTSVVGCVVVGGIVGIVLLLLLLMGAIVGESVTAAVGVEEGTLVVLLGTSVSFVSVGVVCAMVVLVDDKQ
jgi:hypothetical protein